MATHKQIQHVQEILESCAPEDVAHYKAKLELMGAAVVQAETGGVVDSQSYPKQWTKWVVDVENRLSVLEGLVDQDGARLEKLESRGTGTPTEDPESSSGQSEPANLANE